ncbi:outer membrane protein assembly factor BamC [Rivibacter subsaxonicus]|uniref:Beta-barrel assembly machine subunit BamC n=1 Tax=Rivibacter subsaxonicus TaxID=457575 RepID=A0A4Q7VNT7_9BURK|nr:outer membrane protein assembly factor BamC [Rivibacter subsaxonicus]RZT97884.1 Beta-barrel assembly machine subunit BamC [Rivibacter subsaxonicus]
MIRSRLSSLLRLSPLALAAALAACSSINSSLEGDKVDYKNSGTKQVSLEVPPDLSALQRDQRYAPVAGAVNASALQGGAAPTPVLQSATGVAPTQVGNVKLMRDGDTRWLSTTLTPDQVWPQLSQFWTENGFTLDVEQRDAGVMQTNWNENRAKLQQDIIRNTLGKVLDNFYDTGERDSFRTRIERTPTGSEIFISHRGMVEVYIDQQKVSTTWRPRPADPQLEAAMLARLMTKLGAQEEQVKAQVAATGASDLPARARMLPAATGTAMQVDEPFDRAWRRVGLALDRSGFTVEDRDRAQGLFFVRYIDPSMIGKGDPGWTDKVFGLFSGGEKKPQNSGPARYRVALKGEGQATTLAVQNLQGEVLNDDAAQGILKVLVNELK